MNIQMNVRMIADTPQQSRNNARVEPTEVKFERHQLYNRPNFGWLY